MEPARALSDHLRHRLLRLRTLGPAGEGAPLLRGDGLEFAELRAYGEGDDPRRIDWAATARTGALQTRVMLEESGLALACAIDGGPRMALGRRRPLSAAAAGLARLWLAAARDRDRLWFVADGAPVALGTLRGERAAALASRHVRPEGGGRAIDAATLNCLDGVLPAGTALLLIAERYTLEALLDDRHLARLPQRRWCAAMVAADPWREGLPLRGAVRLRDAADGSVRTLRIDEAAAERHARACAQREVALLERLTRMGWHARLFDESTAAAELLNVC